jgi:hypothetical protein
MPFRAIYYDLDGSLTGLGPGSWATPNWTHNIQPGCNNNASTLFNYSGIICDSSVTIRRIVYHNYAPDVFGG